MVWESGWVKVWSENKELESGVLKNLSDTNLEWSLENIEDEKKVKWRKYT